ncbi:MAG: Esterase EstD [Formosa sp. Hel1_33_131]|jgi:alpha/beta superfamily hydrolase|nr:MAG: Esterase EstD [Formosa sp. Hel1_33_131]|tara:strand:- start:756 stop:1697 length:942 start_codon:yes stop_codon:yes gene_type:complete
MKFIHALICSILCTATILNAQNYSEIDIEINQYIGGTLVVPNSAKKPPLVILIAGSGPTDRDGNQSFMKNNMLKKLAEGLSKKGMATFRYDKRIVKQLRTGNFDKNTRFDDFVTDAKSVLLYFKSSYPSIYIAGHSQGSLVGMLASESGVDGFISLSGAANPIDQIILEQISKTAPVFIADTKRVLDLLKMGETTSDFPIALSSIFNLDTQPFMINWMQYNPKKIIKNLDIPVLIINGTKGLQVSKSEAQLLKDSKKDAELVIIENMNHILFEIYGDDLVNSKSYNETNHPIMPEVLDVILNFIRKEKSTITK